MDESSDCFNNLNVISLSCGHSICENCHIELINNKNNIFIKCPICREINDITKTNPNYELNDKIFTIKLILSKLATINTKIKTEYNLLKFTNKDLYTKIIKSKTNTLIPNRHHSRIIKHRVSKESPW